MLKTKPFLLALCLIPVSFTAFQAPVRAQGKANFTTSQGVAGTPSGVNVGASGTTVFSSPRNTSNSNNGATQVLVNAPPSAGAAASAILQTLNNDGSVASSTTLVLISSDRPFLSSFSDNQVTIAGQITNPTPGSAPPASVNGITVTANAATGTFTASRGGISLASIVTPTATTAGSVTVGTVTVAVPAIANPTLAKAASQAAIAVILAGGSPNQAAAAAQIAATGAGVGASVRLVGALANLIPTTFDSAANPLLNLNASLLKSLDNSKELTVAQGKKGASVNPAQLAEAIIAYNEVLDTSSPQVVAELSKNKAFLQIGQTLRKLRSAFGD